MGVGNLDNDWSGTVANALTDAPFIGPWTDTSPNNGGTIVISSPATDVFRVDFTSVPYFSSVMGLPNATYGIQVDAATGVLQIDGLGGIQPSTELMFLGVSKGNTGATDGGPATFTVSGPNLPANATNMIYMTGPAGTLAPGGSATPP